MGALEKQLSLNYLPKNNLWAMFIYFLCEGFYSHNFQRLENLLFS